MFVRDHNRLCWGVDLVEEHLLTSCGLPCTPPKAPRPLRASAGIYVSAEASGTVGDDAVLREYVAAGLGAKHGHPGDEDSVPRFSYFTPMVTAGDAVLGPADAADFPTWLCGFMLHAPSADKAIALAKRVNDDVVARVAIDAAP